MDETLVEEIKTIPEASDVMPAEGLKAVETHQPEDLAATFFKMYQPRLKILLANMSAKQLRRLIFNAVSYPLVDVEYKPKTKEEKDALYMIHEMVLNKVIMQLSYEMSKVDEASKKQPLVSQETAELTEEEQKALEEDYKTDNEVKDV